LIRFSGAVQDVEMTSEQGVEMRGERRRTIQIRLYEKPDSWAHIRELEYACNSNGDVDLKVLERQLAVEGTLRVGLSRIIILQ
jgi:hypothetical protein